MTPIPDLPSVAIRRHCIEKEKRQKLTDLKSTEWPRLRAHPMTRGGTPDPTRPWRGWYALTRWRKRRRHQLYLEPYCKLCAERGVLRAAEIVDHVKHHGGRWNDFWLGELQSLCKQCHDSSKKLVELYGYDPKAVDADGWPADPNHPANR